MWVDVRALCAGPAHTSQLPAEAHSGPQPQAAVQATDHGRVLHTQHAASNWRPHIQRAGHARGCASTCVRGCRTGGIATWRVPRTRRTQAAQARPLPSNVRKMHSPLERLGWRSRSPARCCVANHGGRPRGLGRQGRQGSRPGSPIQTAGGPQATTSHTGRCKGPHSHSPGAVAGPGDALGRDTLQQCHGGAFYVP